MTEQMISEFIGKTVIILADGDLSTSKGKVVACQDNWMKIQNKKEKVNFVNLDYVKSITVVD